MEAIGLRLWILNAGLRRAKDLGLQVQSLEKQIQQSRSCRDSGLWPLGI